MSPTCFSLQLNLDKSSYLSTNNCIYQVNYKSVFHYQNLAINLFRHHKLLYNIKQVQFIQYFFAVSMLKGRVWRRLPGLRGQVQCLMQNQFTMTNPFKSQTCIPIVLLYRPNLSSVQHNKRKNANLIRLNYQITMN